MGEKRGERGTERGREGQRYRGTEGQRDTETEGHRDRGTEGQGDRGKASTCHSPHFAGNVPAPTSGKGLPTTR